MGMALSGLASGFDWKSIVDQLIEVSRAPQNRMRREQTTNSQKSSALDEIRGKLASLKTSVAALNSPDSLLKKSATIADKNSNWTATATKDTPAGDYNVEMISEATTTVFNGAQGFIAGFPDGNLLSQSWMGAPLTLGTFTINGTSISIDANTKWNDPVDPSNSLVHKISAIPDLTASFVNDKISISSLSQINLGAASDTSNFLQLARLFNNGGNTVISDAQSQSGIAKLNLNVPLSSSSSNFYDFGVPLSGGSILVNGKSINVNSSMTGQDVLNAITNSQAGVTASYDSANGRIVLKNKTPGNGQITVQDVGGGNIAARFGINTTAGFYSQNPPILLEGKNAAFRINGQVFQSKSSTLTEAEHGIKGLTINANSLSTSLSSVTNNTAANGFNPLGSNYTAGANGDPVVTPAAYSYLSFPKPLASNISVGSIVSGPNIPPGTTVSHVQADMPMHTVGTTAVMISSLPGGNVPVGSTITFTNSYTPTKITVAGDTSAAKDALNDFVAKYNDVQNTIEKHTKVTVNGTKVTSSILSGNQELNILARSLRSSLFQSAGLTGTVNRLSDLGITSMGIQNTISLSNATALESKLSSAADDLANFFKTPTTGFVARFDKLLNSVVTESGSAAGSFKARQDSISKQNSSIDKQIEDMERRLASQRAMLESSFIAMERAQSGFQQQSAYLAKTFNGK
jgi:flagellar capping protein FliD